MSAWLHQAHAPWPTETFIELDFAGPADRYRPVSGSARVPVSVARQIGLALTGLAADASREGVSA